MRSLRSSPIEVAWDHLRKWLRCRTVETRINWNDDATPWHRIAEA